MTYLTIRHIHQNFPLSKIYTMQYKIVLAPSFHVDLYTSFILTLIFEPQNSMVHTLSHQTILSIKTRAEGKTFHNFLLNIFLQASRQLYKVEWMFSRRGSTIKHDHNPFLIAYHTRWLIALVPFSS